MATGKVTKRSTAASAAAANTADAGNSEEPSDSMGTIAEASIFNNSIVRAFALTFAMVASGFGSSFAPDGVAVGLHLAASGIWLGVNLWTTFFAGLTMFKNLPRQTFGKLQSKLFPMYFGLVSLCSALLLGTLGIFDATIVSNRVMATLVLGLVTGLSNLLAIEPAATTVLFERYELENSGVKDEEARSQLTKKFGALHGLSSMANLGNLAAAVAHTVWLAGLMQQVVL